MTFEPRVRYKDWTEEEINTGGAECAKLATSPSVLNSNAPQGTPLLMSVSSLLTLAPLSLGTFRCPRSALEIFRHRSVP